MPGPMDELRSRPNPRRSARPFFRSLACPRLSARSRGCRRSETDCFARKCAKAWFELEAARTPPIHGRRARLGGEADSQPVRDLLRARRVRGAGPDVLGGGSCCPSGAFRYLCMLVRPCAAWEPAAPAHGVVLVVGGGVAVPARPQGGTVALEEGHALRPTRVLGMWMSGLGFRDSFQHSRRGPRGGPCRRGPEESETRRVSRREQGRALRTRCTLITVRRKAAVLRIRSDSRGREGGTGRRREGGREGGREDEKSARVLHREGERERGREGGETEVDKRG